jgi:hypothetical protein
MLRNQGANLQGPKQHTVHIHICANNICILQFILTWKFVTPETVLCARVGLSLYILQTLPNHLRILHILHVPVNMGNSTIVHWRLSIFSMLITIEVTWVALKVVHTYHFRQVITLLTDLGCHTATHCRQYIFSTYVSM